MNHYKAAIWLAVALTVLQGAFALYYMRNIPIDRWLLWVALGPVTIMGLWLLSAFLRYSAAAILLCWGAVMCWQLVSDFQKFSIIALFFFLAFIAIMLSLGALLLLSKPFSMEFTRQRASMPRYKIISRRVLHWTIVVVAAVATLNDIVHLAQN